jgi:hypothetical protein
MKLCELVIIQMDEARKPASAELAFALLKIME